MGPDFFGACNTVDSSRDATDLLHERPCRLLASVLGYMIICTFISPKISSALVKATGSYTASMIYAIIACILAVVFYTTIPQPKRRTLAEVAAEEKAAQEKAAQA